MEITIDVDSLRNDLINYFGSASPMCPMALADVVNVESADAQDLVQIALDNGFDIFKYQV